MVPILITYEKYCIKYSKFVYKKKSVFKFLTVQNSL